MIQAGVIFVYYSKLVLTLLLLLGRVNSNKEILITICQGTEMRRRLALAIIATSFPMGSPGQLTV